MKQNLFILNLDHRQQAIFQFEAPMFQLLFLDSQQIEYLSGEVPWHWHEMMEIVIVLKGTLHCESENCSIDLHSDEALFINTKSLHMLRPVGDEECKFCVILFSQDIIGGFPGGLFDLKYIFPLMRNKNIPAIPFFSDGVKSEQEIIIQMKNAVKVCQEKGPYWELRLRNILSEIWLQLLDMSNNIPQSTATDRASNHIKQMLSYIEKSYDLPIKVNEIASAAYISERECYRCFKKILNTTPNTYLQEYRIHIAMRLLSDTTSSIADVCYAVGFDNIGYFGKLFRKKLGMTPREYRFAVWNEYVLC